MTENQFLRWLFGGDKSENPDDGRVNFPAGEGIRTRHSFHTVYVKMMMVEGNDKVTVGRLTKNDLRVFFEDHGIDARILDFDPSLEGQALIEQPFYRSEEHTSELQSRGHLVCRLLLEKKKKTERRSTPVIESY